MFKFSLYLLFTLLLVNLSKSQSNPQLIIEYGDGQCKFVEKEGENLNYIEVTPTLYHYYRFMTHHILLFDSKENLFRTTQSDIYSKCSSGLENPIEFPRGTLNFQDLSGFHYDETQKFCLIIFNNGNGYNLYKLDKNNFGGNSDTMFFDEQNGTFIILLHPGNYQISDNLKAGWEKFTYSEKSTTDHSEASTSESNKPAKKPKRKFFQKVKGIFGGNNF
uniref:Transmembrane protein n=1 Tax=Meloidogyne floridensis TaxID=298350 RepID=A0A915NWR7_9BILA